MAKSPGSVTLMIAGGAAFGASMIMGSGEYNKAQELRGRDNNRVEDVAQYIGDLPHLINIQVVDQESYEETQPYEVPLRNTIPAAIIGVAGVTVLLTGLYGMTRGRVG